MFMAQVSTILLNYIMYNLFRAYMRRTPSSTGSGIRQDGNIARLRGDNGEDSDEESNTYNGNSTQQM